MQAHVRKAKQLLLRPIAGHLGKAKPARKLLRALTTVPTGEGT
jgi:hypothetical protein